MLLRDCCQNEKSDGGRGQTTRGIIVFSREDKKQYAKQFSARCNVRPSCLSFLPNFVDICVFIVRMSVVYSKSIFWGEDPGGEGGGAERGSVVVGKRRGARQLADFARRAKTRQSNPNFKFPRPLER